MAYVNTLNVSGTDYTLQDKDAIKMDLLWTNANPTNTFNATTMPSFDTTGYDMIKVVSIMTTTNQRYNSFECPNPGQVQTSMVYGAGAVITGYYRTIEFTGTSATFGDAYTAKASSETKTNNVMVPYKIYGIKIGS